MKRLIFFGIGLVTGAGVGAGLTYIFTKNACEKRSQEAIDDMKHFYEDGAHKEIKGFQVEEGSNEESTEQEVIKRDKPPISEMSGLFDRDNDNHARYTNYNFQNTSKSEEQKIDEQINELKERLKRVTDSNKNESTDRFAVIDHPEFVSRQNAGYSDRDYSFEAEAEQWVDEMSGADIDVEDLPFDPEIIQWNDLDQCYILDEERKSVYMVEKL